MKYLILPLVWLHILAHSALFVIDYFQLVPLVDFIKRSDGTKSDPINLLPLELIYAGNIAMLFSTVSFSFLMALIFKIGTIQSASFLSVWFHGIFAIFIVIRWDAWKEAVHPMGSVQPEFFLTTHIVWIVLSFIVILLDHQYNRKTKNKTE